MKTELAFSIEEEPIEILIKEKSMYPALRRTARTRSESRAILEDRLEKLDIAEMNTNISVLYQLYKEGVLSEEFGNYVTRHDGDAYFGDDYSRCRAQAKICRVLADLDVPKIGASKTLGDLYHALRVEVDDSKKEHRSFLHSEYFWQLYFMFYHEYYRESSD